MHKLYKLFLIFVLFSSLTTAYGQSSYLSKNELMEDYEILYTSLVNYHPRPFLYTSEADLSAYYEAQKSNLPDSLTSLEFHIVARKLIAQIKCGHTFGKPSRAWYKSVSGQKVLLPFDVKIVDEKFYISKTVETDFDFKIGDELLAINQVPVQELYRQMADIQQRDGLTQSFVHAQIEKTFRTYFLFLNGSFIKEYTIEYKNHLEEVKTTTVSLTNKRLEARQNPTLPSNLKEITQNKWSTFAMDTISNLAYLKISTFSDRKEFKKHYKFIFKYLQQYPDAKLIVDLRNNGGGFFGNGNNLLTYLTPEKFEFHFQTPKRKLIKSEYITMDKWSKLTKLAFSLKPSKRKIEGQSGTTFTYKPSKYQFEGKAYVIINGGTFSLASWAAAHLNEYGATFFGEETGGTKSGSNALLNHQLILPHSQVNVMIPYYEVISTSTKAQFGQGVKPDYSISPALNTNSASLLEIVLETVLQEAY